MRLKRRLPRFFEKLTNHNVLRLLKGQYTKEGAPSTLLNEFGRAVSAIIDTEVTTHTVIFTAIARSAPHGSGPIVGKANNFNPVNSFRADSDI